MPILTVTCQNHILDHKTNLLRNCNRFLSRTRYEGFSTSAKAFNMELICGRCKARSIIIWDDENKMFQVVCLSKDKTEYKEVKKTNNQ